MGPFKEKILSGLSLNLPRTFCVLAKSEDVWQSCIIIILDDILYVVCYSMFSNHSVTELFLLPSSGDRMR
jgi:hypothetical protein